MGLEFYLLDLVSKCFYFFYFCEVRIGFLRRNFFWSGYILCYFDYVLMFELFLFDKGLCRLLKIIN